VKSLKTAAVLLSACITARTAMAQSSRSCTDVDPSPRVFGPTIPPADSGRIYSSTLSPDGNEFYFFKHVGSKPEDYRIFRSSRTSAGWREPEIVDLGGEFSDLYPALSPDGTRLVFSSYRPAPGDTSSRPNAHLWMATRTPTGWSRPEFVAASRLGYYHSALRQDAAGTLHLRLTSPDWRTASDMQLRWIGARFDSALTVDAVASAVDYWRARSGDSIYVWGGLEGPGGLSLLSVSRVAKPSGNRSPGLFFSTFRRGESWTTLVPAGGPLSTGAPNFAWFSADGCYVHFTRDYYQFMRVPVGSLRGDRSRG